MTEIEQLEAQLATLKAQIERKSIKGRVSFADLRKVIMAGRVAKRLYRQKRPKNVDKFLSDYNF